MKRKEREGKKSGMQAGKQREGPLTTVKLRAHKLASSRGQ